jgi:hypothetical protein
VVLYASRTHIQSLIDAVTLTFHGRWNWDFFLRSKVNVH